ncbi:MAG: zeta toxin family protein [Clostridium tyrobutyricum]|jgi:predicted ABC-type ATPase|uniref:zeta toxin family protein n=1 Tax=Clostridium tyrobutyricum TaxID=1519 RepID=UPI00242E7D90|nr:zeta toxin family protein [Clostridium tyrobutyricum]MCH4200637.1 zeta toxin family protein [Clostridium tyrobutyricum]MCH4237535.1 zeta toxin family protein [Clostridium tyrobutyricum]MCH4260154.1 zeta toxin family protein [Clostridium tyrobutyricum]MCI2011736.1 zeta toxin family protein [Clostridium tyrobutyricum]
MSTYTLFAGVNGAGKTSIYKSIYYKKNKNELRINTDEMVARIGSWKDSNLQIKCAREAVKLIKYYILNKMSFNQETTLCGKSILNNIIYAKRNGFYIKLNYVLVSSPEIAKERVALRIKEGGHGIPNSIIERRYYESLKNLKNIIKICDETKIYDNTNSFKGIGFFEYGNLSWKDQDIPNVLKETLKDYM